MTQRFWVFEWFDEYEIFEHTDIDRLLADPKMLRSFREAATRAPNAEPAKVEDRTAITAGRGLDFSGIGDCARRACIAAHAERLLRRTWHYFDTAIISDMTPTIVGTSLKHLQKELIAGWLDSLLVARNANAEQALRVVRKDVLCLKCGREHADRLLHGADGTFASDDFAAMIDKISTIEISQTKRKSAYKDVALSVPAYNLEFTVSKAATWLSSKGEADIKEEMVHAFVDGAVHSVSTDIYVARLSDAGLATASQVESFFLRYFASPDGDLANEIAYNVPLPFVQNVPLKELYRLRDHMGDAFELYKAHLRNAIHERIKTINDPQPEKIARDIYESEIAEPLARLRSKLDRNVLTLVRDFAGATVSAAVGVAGLLTNVPAVAAGGFGAAAALSVAALNVYKERDELSAGDMFFLLSAESHTSH